MSDSPKHVTVRLRVPPELRDKISASSEQYNRSMNADMVARLEQSFQNQVFVDLDKIPLEDLTAHLFKRFNRSGLQLTVEEINKTENKD